MAIETDIELQKRLYPSMRAIEIYSEKIIKEGDKRSSFKIWLDALCFPTKVKDVYKIVEESTKKTCLIKI